MRSSLCKESSRKRGVDGKLQVEDRTISKRETHKNSELDRLPEGQDSVSCDKDEPILSILRFSEFIPDASDQEVLRAVTQSVNRFNAVDVSIVHEPEGRMAYAFFYYCENCWWCWKSCREKMPVVVRGKAATVDIVYQGPSRFTEASSEDVEEKRCKRQCGDDEEYPFKKSRQAHFNFSSSNESLGAGDQRSLPTVDSPAAPYQRRIPNSYRNEDELSPSRTVFVGRLESGKTEKDVERIFGRYGKLVNVIIRRPPNTPFGHAFVAFADLRAAERAKINLNGKYFGSVPIVTGYAPHNPTNILWIGGLSRVATTAKILDVFSQFGTVEEIDGKEGQMFRYVTFSRVSEAQHAFAKLRMSYLGSSLGPIKVDYARPLPTSPKPADTPKFASQELEEGECSSDSDVVEIIPRSVEVDFNCSRELNSPSSAKNLPTMNNSSDNVCTEVASFTSLDESKIHVDGGAGVCNDVEYPTSNVQQLEREKSVCVWSGYFMLRSSTFYASLWFAGGDISVIENLAMDDDGEVRLRITRKILLAKSWAKVKKYAQPQRPHGIFIAKGIQHCNIDERKLNSKSSVSGSGGKIRSLSLLVAYLKKRGTAGVVVVEHREPRGVFFAFPSCTFSRRMFAQRCPNMELGSMEDYLIVVGIPASSP